MSDDKVTKKADDLKDEVVEERTKAHDPKEQPVQTNPLGEEIPHGDGEPREKDGQDNPA